MDLWDSLARQPRLKGKLLANKRACLKKKMGQQYQRSFSCFYMHIYKHTYPHTHIHEQAHTYTVTYIHTHRHPHMHMRTLARAHTHTHTESVVFCKHRDTTVWHTRPMDFCPGALGPGLAWNRTSSFSTLPHSEWANSVLGTVLTEPARCYVRNTPVCFNSLFGFP